MKNEERGKVTTTHLSRYFGNFCKHDLVITPQEQEEYYVIKYEQNYLLSNAVNGN